MGTYEEILETFKEKIKTVSVVEIADIPKIDLYMDQVTTFMDQALAPYKRLSDGKVLTKTMINNYTKAKVLPPPVKKKYGRTHIMLLIMIFHLKSVLSIKDIATLFQPIFALPTKEDAEKQTEKFMLDLSICRRLLLHICRLLQKALLMIPFFSRKSWLIMMRK